MVSLGVIDLNPPPMLEEEYPLLLRPICLYLFRKTVLREGRRKNQLRNITFAKIRILIENTPRNTSMPTDTFAVWAHNRLCQICSKSVQLFGIFPTFLIREHLTPFKCPLWLEVLFCLAYFHSLINQYTCAKFGRDRSRGLEAFTYLWIYDPLSPMHLGYQGVNFSSCPYPD